MKLVMLETNGNQRFVFSSPRLRDNVGASYLITQLADWTEQAASKALPRIDFGWVSKSSGKVILTVATEDDARRLIGEVTRKAFSAAPGLDVSGVFVDMCDPGNEVKRPHISNRDLKEVHRKAAEYALNRPPAQARFSQMPFLQRGRDSALPASSRLGVCDEAKDDKETALSLSSRVCRYRANDARKQFIELAEDYFLKVIEGHWNATRIKELLVRDPTKLEEKLEEKRKRKLVKELLEEFEGNIDSTVPKDTKKYETDKRKNQAGNDRDRAEGKRDGQTEGELIDRKDRTEDERLSKVAVIHIDGNGVCGIMRNLQESLETIPDGVFRSEVLGKQTSSDVAEESTGAGQTDDPHKSPDALRCFLLEINRRLEEAMQKSFLTAWAEVAFLAEKEVKDIAAIPVVPVILGGDDATVITDATYALPFTEKFLTAFEEETGKDELLKYLGPESRRGKGEGAKSGAENAGNNDENGNPKSTGKKQGGPMTAAAGIAIVRRKFPFHIAYDLAERLIKSAKALGKTKGAECSTLNFHVLFDSTVLDPDELLRSYESFTRRPFKVISNVDLGVSDVDLGVSDVDLDVKAKEDRSVAKEIMESPHGHPTWKDMCKYTRLFIGLPQSQKSDKNPTGSPNEERGSLNEETGLPNEDLQGSPRKDLKGSPNEELRFPMTRATRIRKIQSDAAKRGMGEEISRLTREIFKTSIGQSESNIDEPKNRESGGKQKLDWNNPSSVAKKIVDEWNVALESLESARKSREEQKPNATQASGDLPQNDAGTKNSGRGAPSRKEQDAPNPKEQDAPNWKQLTPNDLFDLIELADLLPQSYLEELTRKETGQKGAAGQKSATDQHHQSDAIQKGVTGHTGKAGQGNSDSTSGNGPAAASQEARK